MVTEVALVTPDMVSPAVSVGGVVSGAGGVVVVSRFGLEESWVNPDGLTPLPRSVRFHTVLPVPVMVAPLLDQSGPAPTGLSLTTWLLEKVTAAPACRLPSSP